MPLGAAPGASWEFLVAKRRRRTATLVLAALVLAVAAGIWFLMLRPADGGSDAAASTVVATDPPKTAPPSAPATAYQQDAGGIATDAPRATAATPTSTGPQTVPVAITYGGYSPEANAVLVGGYADGVVESDGTCTLELANGGTTRRVEDEATADAATTSCGEMRVPMAQLSSGTWQATLRYNSSKSQGVSKPVPVPVP